MANIKVAVRVRPISARELHVTGSEVVVRTDGNTIFLTNLKVSASKAGDSRERTRRYDFNYCFDSSDPDAENYANQSRIYETLGQSVLDALFMGYNACFVAYGQSASGKTYTMMGSKDDPGLTPRLCEGIFARIQEEERKERNHRVTVSYLEIYNDRVRDLLKPAASGRGLKVREHPRLGPYVQGLTHHVVGTLGSLMSYVEEGARARKTALTLQNSSSSRSHALLTVSLCSESSSAGASQLAGASSIGGSCTRRKDAPRGGGNKLHLVDLAGSESAATCSGVNRLKEGANINKSLVALGNVISALAERGSTGSGPGRRFIPYRDSSLTWLLKDAFGGNATTIMLATISPASGSYNETAHTLRFAQRAQSVVNRPVVNENPVARIIRELRDEVARLKSLLLEKENIDPGSKSLCCCKEIQTVDNPDSDKDQSASTELSSDRHCMEVKNRSRSTERAKEEREAPSIRRFNSTESLSTSDSGSSGPIRKFGSFEFLGSKSPLAVCNYYNRAKVTELNDEEDEIVDEINEPVFVDIPTLVAVLIKPDDSLQESSTQIEEICSDEAQEDSIDVEFIENANGQEVFVDVEKLESVEQAETSSVNSTQLSADAYGGDCQRNTEEAHVSATSPRGREKGKFRKQDSIDVVTHSGSSNLHTSKRFGSVEGLQKKKEPHLALERSHTNLEKRPAASDRTKKLNNIREIDDQKAHGKQVGGWKGIASSGSKDHLQRKGSNDSDKSLKESNGGQSGSKSKNGAVRKPSLENLKRKTSKDSSSSSSKEEQIVISNLTRDKLLRRKGSLDQEPPVARAHTPIQRVKRAEIVAAVTERLYASRKHVEESATASTPGSGTRSPPEAADVKLGSPFATRTKLQEISRKMLAKRRRVCVDTQTDIDRTVRVKDTASLTEEPQVILQDAAVLTDHHENCEVSTEGSRVPVLRVKEIATLTDKPRTPIVRCKDAESLATDLDDYDYEIHSPRNDSGILSDDTQNYAESNLSSTEVSDACIETDRRVVCTDSSTNTMYLSPGRSPIPIPQAPRQELVRQQPKGPRCDRQCCNMSPEVPQIVTPASPEKNVISISLPDMISITIESTNGIESRIAMTDCSDSAETAIRPKLRDIEAQTDERSVRKDEEDDSAESHFCFKDLSRSATGLTDGKIFRIENIFQDPKIASKACTKVDTVSDAGEDSGPRKSVTFTNSLGTSFVPDTRERATEMEREKIHAEDKAIDFQKRSSFAQAFVSKRRGYERSLPEAPQSAFYSNSPAICTCPAAAIDSAEFKKEFEIVSPGWQRACNEVSRNGLIFSCHNGVVCMAANNCVPLLMKRRQIENPYETRNSTTLPACDRCSSLTEPCIEKPPTISPLDANNDYECNFSDDSLDYDEEDVSNNGQPGKSEEVKNRENHDNLCPPDVVAHTKKDASTSSGYIDAENTESSANSDFEDSHVELPRKKTADMSSGTKLHDYKSLILGDSLIMFSESSVEEEEGFKTPSSQSSGSSKKRVSFSNVTEERSQRKLDRQALSEVKQSPHVELKSIIKKKKKKSNMPETIERSQSSTDSTSTDDSLHSKMSLTDDSQDSCAGFDAASAKLEKHLESIGNSRDSDEFCGSQDDGSKGVQFSSQEFDDNYSETDSECNAITDEEYSASLRRDIVREYLDQATTFMRNMNSINEYMNATKMLDRPLGRGKRRGHRRRGYRPQNQDYVEYQGRRISLKHDPAEYIDDDDDDFVVPIESYERCLASINRLESCIERVNKHNDLLREKYNIDVESAGARHDLAGTSSDPTAHRSRNDNVKANPTIEVPPENVSRSSRNSRNSWFADQADYGRDLDAAERHIVKQISDLDLDGKNSARHGLEDDLEKRIFDQLMSVVESSRCTRRLRDRYPSETLDHSPPTYSRSRARYRSDKQHFFSRDADDCVNLDRPSSPMESILNNNQVGNDNFRAVSASTTSAMYESVASVPRRSRSLDNVESEEHDLSVSDELTGPPRTKNVCARSYDSDAFSRRIKDFVPSKRISSTDIGASKIENSSYGDNVGPNVRSIDAVSHFRDKLKYPGSPRVKFLELLNERRRIVESTRGMSAS